MYNIPKLKNNDVFENLCLDIVKKEYKEDFYKYGRNGQNQNGIDILNSNANILIQCKNYNSDKLKISNFLTLITDDLKRAEEKFDIKEFIVMTSLDRDVKIQDYMVKVNRSKNYKVKIFFWNDIEIKMDEYKLILKYYSELNNLNIPIKTLNKIRECCKIIVKCIENFQNDFQHGIPSQENYRMSAEIFNNYFVSMLNSFEQLKEIKYRYSIQLEKKGLYSLIQNIVDLIPEIYDLENYDIYFYPNVIATICNLTNFYSNDTKTIKYCKQIESIMESKYN
jgi:hypothetical protein